METVVVQGWWGRIENLEYGRVQWEKENSIYSFHSYMKITDK